MRPFQSVSLGLMVSLPALAQSPRFGMNLNLLVPTGEFLETIHPASPNGTARSKEGFDAPGLEMHLWVSYPLNRVVALRPGFSFTGIIGTYDDPGVAHFDTRQYTTSLRADVLVFPRGGALGLRGTYLFVGVAEDFERFERGHDAHDYYNDLSVLSTVRRNRLGGNIGLGHSFGDSSVGSGRWNWEVGYHTTLRGRNPGDPPRTSEFKIGIGFVN